jgi:hypothetical protein
VGLKLLVLFLGFAVRLGDPLVVASLPLLEILAIPAVGSLLLLVAQPLLLGRLPFLPTPPEAGWRLLRQANGNRQRGRHPHNANRH